MQREETSTIASNAIKYLGIIVDNHLSWRSHLEKVRKKCLSVLAVLHKIKRSLPPKLRNVLYQSMVLPHLDFRTVAWAECCKDDATKLERIQQSGMRLILNEGWNCQSSVMRCRLPPQDMRNMLKTNEDMRVHSAQHSKEYLPPHRTSWLERSFIFCAGRD